MEKIGLLPGPVNIRKSTLECLGRVPISHRSEKFKNILADTRSRLSALVGVKECALFTGSGTLANEVVGAQLIRVGGSGMVLSNGEFGERLAEQGRRLGLRFTHFKHSWGEPLDYCEIEAHMRVLRPRWLWFVHFETSVSRLNDLARLTAAAEKYRVKLCVDVISSIGNMPLDLSGAYLAAASSGKGLAAVAGLGIVFSNHSPKPDANLPKYLDLGFNLANDGLPFTISSNHVAALNHEIREADLDRRFEEVSQMGAMIRNAAEASCFRIVGGEDFMLTLELPRHINSVEFGDRLAQDGVDIHYKSAYLAKRNWIQIALMGYPKLSGVKRFLRLWKRYERPVQRLREAS